MSLRLLSADFAFYGILDLLQRSISLVMVPVYTRVLTQGQYGDLDMIMILLMVLLVLVDLQFLAGFSRLYLDHERAGTGARFAGTVHTARLVGGLVVPALFVAAGHAGYLEFPFLPSFIANATAWTVAAAGVPVSLVFDVLLMQTRMLRWKRAFATGALGSTLGSAVLSVWFVLGLDWGIAGILAGLSLGRLGSIVPMAWALRHHITPGCDRTILREIAQYSLPLIPGWWVSFASAYAGRFFVYGIKGPEENALLAVCMKVASIIGLYSVSFRQAWHPLAMAQIGTPEAGAFYVRSMRLFAAGGFLAICLLTAGLQPLLAFLAPGSYGPVEWFFPIFAVGVLISECEANLQLGNQIARRTLWISISAAVYVVVNLGVLAWLTSTQGVLAVGIGLAVAGLARAAVTWWSGQRHHPIAYDVRAFGVMLVGCGVVLALGAARVSFGVPGWLFSAAAAATGVIGVWTMLGSDDRIEARALVRHWWQARRRAA